MKTIRIILLMALVFSQSSAFSQVEKYLAAFTFQICKSTSWPEVSDQFTIATIGQSDINPYFEQMAKEKKIGNQTIEFISWTKVDDIQKCHAIFIPKSKISELNNIVTIMADNPVLIITESSGTIKKGANLSFKLIDNKIRYNINKTDLQKRKLNVGSNIERMALKVY